MDSQDYQVVSIEAATEELAEIFEASISELAFNSFVYEDKVLKAYVQASELDEAALREVLADTASMMGIPPIGFKVEKLEAKNWNAEWEQNGFTPIHVGEITVAPHGLAGQGITDPVSDGAICIWLDPQMAFGTGHHHTTYMMMETLLSLRSELLNASVMDLGCGTAVLALVAAKLGAEPVYGIDIDAVAARSAALNVALNGFDFPILCGDAEDLQPHAYDFILANIHRNIIIADMRLYAAALRSSGHLLLSGFYVEDIDDILAAAGPLGFSLAESREREGWACLDLVYLHCDYCRK